MRLVVAGATGRTGSEVVGEAAERGHDVVPLSRSPVGEVAGVELRDADELSSLLAGADALVDFTVPDATREHARACVEAGVPLVVGTTGFDERGSAQLREAGESVPVLKASNFARGVQALLGAVRSAVADLPGYDVELTETHHGGKRDAPSGTAKTVLNEIDSARGGQLDRVYGRDGHHPREENEVGVHVRRAGDVRGEHEVVLAGNDEVLTVSHRAESRGVFAAGAVDAAEWLAGRDPGYYDFADAL